MRGVALFLGLAGLAAALLLASHGSPALADEPIRLKIVGGLAGVSQYTNHELPFWSRRIPQASGGRITADIVPFDQSGLRSQDMLRLLTLGVIPFGTMILSLTPEDPELTAIDLPLVSPDFATLRKTTAAYRPFITEFLRRNQGVELLAIYAYPAQSIFCRRPMRGLADLKGRRVRASSVSQAELMEALGAIPVLTPFADIVPAVQRDVVDCAITGTMSGNGIGLHEVTTHLHELAVSWGLTAFAANTDAWNALPADIRELLTREIGGLEAEIWTAADRDTGEGIACNTGQPGCTRGKRGAMTLVSLTPDDRVRIRSLIADTVLPGWLNRCGVPCAEAWNATLGPLLSIPAVRD